MTLRWKTLLIIGLALIGLILLLYATASAVLLNSFNDLEAETAEGNLERVVNAIGERAAALDVITEDYASWDDSYNYMVDGNPVYIDDNFYNEGMIDLGINLVALYDTTGERVFGKVIDLNEGIELTLPANLDNLILSEGAIFPAGLDNGTAGIVLLEEGPMMLAARPVLNSLGEGPTRGVVIFGRYLDDTEIESLSLLTNVEIELHRPDEIVADAGLAAIQADLMTAGGSLIRPLNDQEIAGYRLFNDIEGNPALLLEVNLPRSIYQQGLTSIRYLLFSLVAVGLMSGGVTLFLIERLVLARLARLSSDVVRIGDSGELAQRVVTMTGRPDELSSLAHEINDMLAGLERSQNSLRESEARYRAVIEQAAEAIFLVDTESGQILEANQAYLNMLGYTAGEITNLSVYDITVHDQLSVQETLEQTVQRGRYMSGEQRLLRKDGTLVDVEVSASLITSGGRQVLCTVAHDITARKRADKELQRLLRETLLLNRVIAAAGTARDPQDVLRLVCQELALALHLPQAAFAVLDPGGQQLTVIAEYVARGRPSALGVMIPVTNNPATQHILKTRQALYIADANTDPRYALMREVAQQRGTVSLLLLPLLIRDRVVGTLGLNATQPREFTAEEMALAQNVAAATSQALENAQLYAAIQQELAERRRAEEEAQKAREVAETANLAKSEFISTVSHELKVPMTAIKGYAELMAGGMAGPVSDRQANFLGIIQGNVERMTRLVSDLTDISRIESGRLRLDFSTVEIGQIILEVAYSIQSQIEAKQQELNLAVAPELPPAWGDRNRLVQILTNLVSNAHKYSPESSRITLSAECIIRQGGPIPNLEMIHVAVADQGIGISPEDQQLLFQRFFRSGDEKARQSPGTGLGLSITKELVELQGGRIWFESEYRRGTTFHFIIPAAVRRI
jgi:PAS domain S-box-containing protein